MTALRSFGVAVASGLLAALGHEPFGLWPATLAGLAILFHLASRVGSRRHGFLVGWSFGAGYFALALAWIIEPFLVDVARHGWMAPFAILFLAGGLALFWGVAAALSAGRGPWMLALCLAVAELARAYVLTGFPWAGFAQVWVGQGADQILAWIGPHGLALLTLLSAASLSRLGTLRWWWAVPALSLAALGAGLGAVLPGTPETRELTLRLVQPNAPQDEKWDPARNAVFFERALQATTAEPRPDLVIWPETSIPSVLNYAGPQLDAIAQAADGVPVVAGLQRFEGPRIYNALLHLDASGAVTEIYDKHHLVPFGEYIPFGDLAARFGISGFAATQGQGFSAGPGPRVLDFGPAGRALPLICYEAIFPRHASAATRPDYLLQLTNDAWFGTWSGPYQHLAQARMRAIEQGLPMVRAANTGVSAVIDPYGRIAASLPLNTGGHVDAALPAPRGVTLYARTGDLPWAALVLAMLAGLTWFQSGGRHRNSD